MLKTLLKLWAESRGTVLKRDLEEISAHLSAKSEEFSTCVAEIFIESIRRAEYRFGDMNTIEPKYRKKISAILRKEARKSYDPSYPQSFGLILASLYIESSTLPGSDAENVYSRTSVLLEAAIKQTAEANAQNDV